MQAGQDVTRLLSNAIKAAKRGASLTQRMLAFARKQELSLKPVDLSDLVRGMAELLQRTIGPGVTIDTRFPLILPAVEADAGQLELALINLAVNARDAMPNGGTITIAAQVERAGHAAVGDAARDYVRLSVSDEGEGMSPSVLAQATEPFFTTKGIGKGTGLGLPMVQGLAQQSGGKFVLASTEGAGTTAEIWMRVAEHDETQPQELEPNLKADARTGEPLVILAVDDDPLVLENTSAMLAAQGHKVLSANSAKEALEVLGKEGVDLIITDYAMPGMTGEELAKRVMADAPQLPILMVSGYASLPERARSTVPRLGKPFKEQELSRAISKVMAAKKAA
jgi:CheY-like chemotaxis protein/two-component sensor histidine kinase